MRRELDVRAYRFVVRLALLIAIAFIVFALFQFLPGTQEAFGTPSRVAEDRPAVRVGIGLMSLGLGILAVAVPQFYRIRPDPQAENLLVLLSKERCSLCDEARLLIRAHIEGTPFTLQEVDLRDHRYLRRFKNHIPVLFWQGDELARLKIEPDRLKAQLDEILARRTERAERMAASDRGQ